LPVLLSGGGKVYKAAEGSGQTPHALHEVQQEGQCEVMYRGSCHTLPVAGHTLPVDIANILCSLFKLKKATRMTCILIYSEFTRKYQTLSLQL